MRYRSQVLAGFRSEKKLLQAQLKKLKKEHEKLLQERTLNICRRPSLAASIEDIFTDEREVNCCGELELDATGSRSNSLLLIHKKEEFLNSLSPDEIETLLLASDMNRLQNFYGSLEENSRAIVSKGKPTAVSHTLEEAEEEGGDAAAAAGEEDESLFLQPPMQLDVVELLHAQKKRSREDEDYVEVGKPGNKHGKRQTRSSSHLD